MPKYDGIVSLDQDEVEVVIGLDPDRVYLRAGDLEIGDWAPEDCAIAHLGDGVYSITAENESLRFVPSNARMFEEGLNHGTGYGLSPAPAPDSWENHRGRHTRRIDVPPASALADEAPPPRPLTRLLFYVLSGMTAGLGVWALLSII